MWLELTAIATETETDSYISRNITIKHVFIYLFIIELIQYVQQQT